MLYDKDSFAVPGNLSQSPLLAKAVISGSKDERPIIYTGPSEILAEGALNWV